MTITSGVKSETHASKARSSKRTKEEHRKIISQRIKNSTPKMEKWVIQLEEVMRFRSPVEWRPKHNHFHLTAEL